MVKDSNDDYQIFKIFIAVAVLSHMREKPLRI